MNQNPKKYFGISNSATAKIKLKYPNDKRKISEDLMNRFRTEFLRVGARFFKSVEMSRNEGGYNHENHHSLTNDSRFVFWFDRHEYLEDIVKTAELVVDELGLVLLGNVIHQLTPVEWSKLKIEFRTFFKACCVEKVLDSSFSEESIIQKIHTELDEIERTELDSCSSGNHLEILFTNNRACC